MGRMRGAGAGRACWTGRFRRCGTRRSSAGPETRPETPGPREVSQSPKSRRVAPRRTYARTRSPPSRPRACRSWCTRAAWARSVANPRAPRTRRRRRGDPRRSLRVSHAGGLRRYGRYGAIRSRKERLGARTTAAGAGTPGATSTIAPRGISFFVGFMSELDAGATEPVRYRESVNPEVYRVRRSLCSAGDGPTTRVPVDVNRSMPLRNALCEPPGARSAAARARSAPGRAGSGAARRTRRGGADISLARARARVVRRLASASSDARCGSYAPGPGWRSRCRSRTCLRVSLKSEDEPSWFASAPSRSIEPLRSYSPTAGWAWGRARADTTRTRTRRIRDARPNASRRPVPRARDRSRRGLAPGRPPRKGA